MKEILRKALDAANPSAVAFAVLALLATASVTLAERPADTAAASDSKTCAGDNDGGITLPPGFCATDSPTISAMPAIWRLVYAVPRQLPVDGGVVETIA